MLCKINSYQSAMNLRYFVGTCLTIFLFLEFFLTIFTFTTSISDNIDLNTPKFYKNLSIFISLTLPAVRIFITSPIANFGYFSYHSKELKLNILPGTFHEASEKFRGPIALSLYINYLSKQIASKTIIALIISFSLSLFIILFSAKMKYTHLEPPKNTKIFLEFCLSYLLFTSPISFSTIIYSLQFFWKNIALTWIINLLLLIPLIPIIFITIFFIFSNFI